jgi:hypothetical protein
MGLPALLFAETWVPRTSLRPVNPVVLDHLRAEVRKLLDEVRRDRPGEGSAAETAALVRGSLLGLSSVRLLGPAFVEVLRAGLNQALADLLRKEIAAAETERKLALRHVEQAVHRYGVLMESLGAELGTLPPSSIISLLDELAEQAQAGELPIRDDERIVLRFQLDVLVALDVLDAPLDELAFWAFRAITDSRRVEAMPAPVTSGLRGELARVRARSAWVGWDAAEVAKELTPWSSPSR